MENPYWNYTEGWIWNICAEYLSLKEEKLNCHCVTTFTFIHLANALLKHDLQVSIWAIYHKLYDNTDFL